MPELPEVETIRKGLEVLLVGQKMIDVDIRLPKMFEGNSQILKNVRILGVRRFGKGLVIDFENEYSLAVHIKMTGQLIYVESGTKGTYHKVKVGQSLPSIHTHVIFTLDKGTLYYNDIRQFGWMKIVKTNEISELPFFKSLGPEPFKDLTEGFFHEIVHNAKLPIKNLLLDQKRIAGVGNIYANDALFLSKIHPKRKASSLSKKETDSLFTALETVLKKGLEAGGASEWQYVNALGEAGNYQNFFKVYGKNGTPCSVCNTTIEKITLGGRGTFFCPSCQPL